MNNFLEKKFQLLKEKTTIKTEVFAGITTFIATSYIIAVNASILSQAGMSYEGVMIATVLTSLIGTLLMAFYANAPFTLIPGMGDNAFFVYVLVLSFGLSWQQSLTATLFAGILFAGLSSKKMVLLLEKSIPDTLIAAMSSGIGLFIVFLGLKNGGLITASENTFVQLGNMRSPQVLITIATLLFMLFCQMKQIKGGFLLGILFGTVLGMLTGVVDLSSVKSVQLSASAFQNQFFAFDFSMVTNLQFWIAVFSLTMMITFQNMGAQLGMLPDEQKFEKTFRVNAISVIVSAFLGSCATTTAAENASGISSGGKTGLTALTAGLLFVPALLLASFFAMIPQEAIAPILIIVGCLMFMRVKDILWTDFANAFPAFLMIVLMPLTFNVVNGIAAGFVLYPITKCIAGKKTEVSPLMFLLAGLFIVYFLVG